MILITGWKKFSAAWIVAATMLLAACGGGGSGTGLGGGTGTGVPPATAVEKSAPQPSGKAASGQSEELPLAQHADGPAASARFFFPKAIAVDRLGNQFVIDEMPDGDSIIRKITSEGHVSTLTSPTASVPDNLLRWRPEAPHNATLYYGIVVDSKGALYVSNTSRQTIEKVDTDGTVSIFAGTPKLTGDQDGPGVEARLYMPGPMAIDDEDTIYFTDDHHRVVRKISPAGVVTTMAGISPVGKFNPKLDGHADGTGSSAQFLFPRSIVVDAQKNLYVRDAWKIRKVTPAGVVTTVAIASSEDAVSGNLGYFSDALAIDAKGVVLAADSNRHVLRKLTETGQISMFSGVEDSSAGYADGPPSSARFGEIRGMAIDAQGTLHVVDAGSYLIRKVDAVGNVSTWAGVRSRPAPGVVISP